MRSGSPPFYTVYSDLDETIPIGEQQRLVDLANLAGVEVHVQTAVNVPNPVNECVEYSGATGCDDYAWFHYAVPTALNSQELHTWLTSRGLGA
jgi:hypothetical protein